MADKQANALSLDWVDSSETQQTRHSTSLTCEQHSELNIRSFNGGTYNLNVEHGTALVQSDHHTARM
eukprot:2591807-Amphidinium_carterae.1